jgi:hypothetical protein
METAGFATPASVGRGHDSARAPVSGLVLLWRRVAQRSPSPPKVARGVAHWPDRRLVRLGRRRAPRPARERLDGQRSPRRVDVAGGRGGVSPSETETEARAASNESLPGRGSARRATGSLLAAPASPTWGRARCAAEPSRSTAAASRRHLRGEGARVALLNPRGQRRRPPRGGEARVAPLDLRGWWLRPLRREGERVALLDPRGQRRRPPQVGEARVAPLDLRGGRRRHLRDEDVVSGGGLPKVEKRAARR